MRALIVPVGDDWYALDVRSVREIVARPIVTAVPTGPRSLLGLFNLRGEIVPLFDTASLVGLAWTAAGPFAAIVQTSLGLAGLSVSGVPESVELTDEQAIDAGTASGLPTYALGSRLATLVDVEHILGGGPVEGGDS